MYKITNKKEQEITLEEAIEKGLIIGAITSSGRRTVLIKMQDRYTFAPYTYFISNGGGLVHQEFDSSFNKEGLLKFYQPEFNYTAAFETYREAYAWMMEE